MMNYKLYYIFWGDFSNHRASNYQVMQTVLSLIRAGVPVRIIIPHTTLIDPEYMPLQDVVYPLSKVNKTSTSFTSLLLFYIRLIRFFRNKDTQENIIYFRHVVLLPVIRLLQIVTPRIIFLYEAHRLVGSFVGKYFEKRVLRCIKGLLVISASLGALYRSRYPGFPKNCLYVLHDGVDFELFHLPHSKEQARNKVGLPANQIIALYIGSLWLVKGVDHIFNAARSLSEISFYLVGRQFPDFKAYIMSHEVPANITILSHVSHPEVALYQRSADVLLLPHPENQLSQSPLKLFEYLASGRPIVASRLQNLMEVLPPHTVTYDPKLPEGIIPAIQTVITQLPYYTEVSLKHNPVVAKKFSWDERARHLSQIIQSL